jgi:hypothetical protein
MPLHAERATAARFQALSFFNLNLFLVAFVIHRPPGEGPRYLFQLVIIEHFQ